MLSFDHHRHSGARRLRSSSGHAIGKYELERLEQRVLLSVTPGLDPDGTVRFTGDDAADVLEIRVNPEGFIVFGLNGGPMSDDFDPDTDGSQRVSAAGASIILDLGEGDDSVLLVGSNGPDVFRINGARASIDGAFSATLGGVASVALSGLDGEDSFRVSPTSDTPSVMVFGGMGPDSLIIDAQGGSVETSEGKVRVRNLGGDLLAPTTFMAGVEQVTVTNADAGETDSVALLDLLDALSEAGDGIDDGVLAGAVPLSQFGGSNPDTGFTFGDLADLGGVMAQVRAGLIAAGYGETLNGTPDLELALSTVNGAFGDASSDLGTLAFEVDPGSVSLIVEVAQDGTQTRLLAFTVTATRTTTLRPADSPGLDATGLLLDGASTVTVTTATSIGLGLLLEGTYALASVAGATTIDATAASLNGSALIGPLSGTVSGATLTMNGVAAHVFNGLADAGALRGNELIDTTTSGTLEGALPFEADAQAGLTVPGTTIILGQPAGTPADSSHDLFRDFAGGATVLFDGPDLTAIFGVDPQTLVDGLERLVEWLTDVERSPILNDSLPMLRDLSVGETLAFSQGLRTTLLEAVSLSQRVSGRGAANAAQELGFSFTLIVDGTEYAVDLAGTATMNTTLGELVLDITGALPAAISGQVLVEALRSDDGDPVLSFSLIEGAGASTLGIDFASSEDAAALGFLGGPVVDAVPAFSTLQELVSLVEGAMGAAITAVWDDANGKLDFDVDIDAVTRIFDAELANTLDLGRLTGLMSGETVTITTTASSTLAFSFSPLVGGGVSLIQEAVTLADAQSGRLSERAFFTLQIGSGPGAESRGVSVGVSATQTNNDLEDLRLDVQEFVNQAFGAGRIDVALVTDAEGSRFAFASGEGDVTIRGLNVTAATGLGLSRFDDTTLRYIRTLPRADLSSASGRVEFDVRVGDTRVNGLSLPNAMFGNVDNLATAFNTQFANAGIGDRVEAFFDGTRLRVKTTAGDRLLVFYADPDGEFVQRLGFRVGVQAAANPLPVAFEAGATSFDGTVSLSWSGHGSYRYGVVDFDLTSGSLRGGASIGLSLSESPFRENNADGFVPSGELVVTGDLTPLAPVSVAGSLTTADAASPFYVSDTALAAIIDASAEPLQLALSLPGVVSGTMGMRSADRLGVTATMTGLLSLTSVAVTELGLAGEQSSVQTLLTGAAPREGLPGAGEVVYPGLLGQDAVFELSVGAQMLTVTVEKGESLNNGALPDLLRDLQNAINREMEDGGVAGSVEVTRIGGRIAITHSAGLTLALGAVDAESAAAFGFTAGLESLSTVVAGLASTTGGEYGQGRLGGDAVFAVQLGAGDSTDVLLSAGDTNTNDGLEDLAGNITEALEAAFGTSPLVVSVVDGRLVFRETAGGAGFTIRVGAANESVRASTSLQALENAEIGDLVLALGDAGERFDDALSGGLLNEALPLLGLSLAQLNGFSQRFGDVVDALSVLRLDTIQLLERALNEQLGLDYDNDVIGPSRAQPGALVRLDGAGIAVDLVAVFDDTRQFDFDLDVYGLAQLASGGVPTKLDGEGVSVRRTGAALELAVLSTAIAELDLRVDYTTGEAETTLGDGTNVRIEFRVAEDNLNFSARIGPTSAQADEAEIVFDADGLLATEAPAAVLLTLGSDTPADEEAVFDIQVWAAATIVLPLFQNASLTTPLGDSPLTLVIADLSALLSDLRDGATGTGSVAFPGADTLADFASLSESQFLELLRNPAFLIDGIDRVLSAIQTAIEAPFAALSSLPLIGDDIIEGVQPMLDRINEMRLAVRTFLEDAYASSIAQANDGDLIEILRETLFDLFAGEGDADDTVTDNNGDGRGPRVGVLKDLMGDGNAIRGLEDILVTTFNSPETGEGVQYDLHIGQNYTVSLPFSLGFGVGDLGLDDLLPNFGFNVDGGQGVTFDLSWDFRFGFGISDTELFYINTEQREILGDEASEVIDELLLAASVSIPGFSTAINLGLVGANVTDGVASPLRLTSQGQITPLSNDDLEGAFRITLFKEDGSEVVVEFDNRGTGMTGGGLLGALSAQQRIVRLVTQLNQQLFELTTGGLIATPDLSDIELDLNEFDPGFGIRLTTRDPSILRMEVEYIAGNDFGFTDGQVEDRRSVGLGFAEEQDSSGGVLLADFTAPTGGVLAEDTVFTIVFRGEDVEVMLRAAQVRTSYELSDGAMVYGRAALAAQLERAIGLALADADPGFTRDLIAVEFTADGRLRLVAAEGDDFSVEWSALQHSFLGVSFGIDLRDVDGDNGRLTLPELAGSFKESFSTNLSAKGEANLHVNTNRDTITDFVEDLVGLDGLGLPEIDFDFVVGFSGTIDLNQNNLPKYSISNLRFQNIQINVGELLSTLVGPILTGIQTVLDPITDIIGNPAESAQGFLNSPVPVISDLASLLNISDDFSWLDFTGNKQTLNTFLDQFVVLFDLLEAFENIDFSGGPIIVNLGCFELDMNKRSPFYFPRTKIPLPCEAVDIARDLEASGQGDILELLRLLGVNIDGEASFESEPGGFKLDLLDPGNILNLILGETFDIFSFNTPRLALDLGLDLGFDFDVLSFGVGGGLFVDAGLSFVYDSTGLDRIQEARDQGLEPDYGDLLDGFYIRTERGPEFEFGADFYGEGGITIKDPIFGVTVFGVEAEVYGEFSLGFDLRDPNEDGALRLDEVLDLTSGFSEPQNLFFLFDIVGSAYFGFSITGTILGVSISTDDLPIDFTRIGGSFSVQDFFQDVFGFDSPFDPIVAEILEGAGGPSKVLRINAGEFDYARIHKDVDDSDGADFTVSSAGQVVTVRDNKTGATKSFAAGAIDTIVFRGTDAGDRIDFSGLNPELGISVDARGGLGNDVIIGGGFNDTIAGGSGSDELYGGDGSDALLGGEGRDFLYGEAGDDVLIGGRDNDQLDGGYGADRYLYGTTRFERSGWGRDTVIEPDEVSGASAGVGGVIKLAATDHGLSVGDSVYVSGLTVGGAPIASIGAAGGMDAPVQITTAALHGLQTGARIRLFGVEGVTDSGAELAPGVYTITSTGGNTFTLDGTVAGGEWMLGTGGYQTGVFDAGNTVEGVYKVSAADGLGFSLAGTAFDGAHVAGTGAFGREGRFLVVTRAEDEQTYVERTGTWSSGGLSGRVEGLSIEDGQYQISSFMHGLSEGASVTVSGIEGQTNANGTYTVTLLSGNRFALNAATPNQPGRVRLVINGHGLGEPGEAGAPLNITGLAGLIGVSGVFTGYDILDENTIVLNGTSFEGDYESRFGAGYVFVDTRRSFEESRNDGDMPLKILTDTIDLSALRTTQGLVFTSADGQTVVRLANDEDASSTVTASFQVETLIGGRGDDLYEVSAGPTHFLRLFGTEGSDRYVVRLSDDILGDIYLQDTGLQPAVDILNVFGTEDRDEVGVTNSQIVFGPGRGIGYQPGDSESGLELIRVELLGGNDEIGVESTPADSSVILEGGAGRDVFLVGVNYNDGEGVTEGNLNAIDGSEEAGQLVINGFQGDETVDAEIDELYVFDTTDQSDNNATNGTNGLITADSITGLGMAVGIEYRAIEILDARLGQGSDELLIVALPSFTSGAVHGGGGSDRIGVARSGDDGPMAIFGDTDALGTHRVDSDGDDVINAASSLLSVFLHGGAGNDTITGGSAGDVITGGTGDDTVDAGDGPDMVYGDSAMAADLEARLTTPSRHTIYTDGVRGREDLDTAGADTLDGGAGDDFIVGDHGRTVTLEGEQLEDGGYRSAGRFYRLITINEAVGSGDVLHGGDGFDVLLGGGGSDWADGGAGKDTLIGDMGRYTQIAFSPVLGVISYMAETRSFDLGSDDELFGGSDGDIILGGTGSDFADGGGGSDIVLGDQGSANRFGGYRAETYGIGTGAGDTLRGGAGRDVVLGADGDDVLFGDEGADFLAGDFGVFVWIGTDPFLPRTIENTVLFNSNLSAEADVNAGDDTIYGGAGDDWALGQQGADTILGGDDDDDLIGGHNASGGSDGADSIDGGAGADVIAGDNAIIRRDPGADSARYADLTGPTLYDGDGNALISDQPTQDPAGTAQRSITLLDHAPNTDPSLYGDDDLAGGAGDDMVFGQLGDDRIQGDGALPEPGDELGASFDAETDGDDYIEGNGGSDLIFGNLGQDDIIGGSSDRFGLTTPEQRLDGADLIYGGSNTMTGRNDVGMSGSDAHGRDADTILGDNGRIIRPLLGGQLISFAYDTYGGTPIIVRVVQFLDTSITGGAPTDIGGSDVIRGGAGDDRIWGGVGNDVLFGDGQDDDLIGGAGNDRLYGGSGEDGIIGDNGVVLTTRNGLAEPLMGLNEANQQQMIDLKGQVIGAVEFIEGRLNKAVDLIEPGVGGSDLIYGGLGDDFLHGGFGIDAISGAEATEANYTSTPLGDGDILEFDEGYGAFVLFDPDNPLVAIEGFILAFDATDGNGAKIEDGKDRLFGGDGHDWLVGGTGKDRMFGGRGNDHIDADDDKSTNGGLNDLVDTAGYNDGDYAFGGSGLDVLIANTGNDRLIDWVGEYNSYFTPFGPYGEPTVIRRPFPGIFEFLLEFGRASGADQSLAEPAGELGLVTQRDREWRDQTGGPRDPQAGNGSDKRDTRGAKEDDSLLTPDEHGSTGTGAVAELATSDWWDALPKIETSEDGRSRFTVHDLDDPGALQLDPSDPAGAHRNGSGLAGL